MRRIHGTLLMVVMLTGCAPNVHPAADHPATAAHDGSSMENAILNDAPGESEGVRAEYR